MMTSFAQQGALLEIETVNDTYADSFLLGCLATSYRNYALTRRSAWIRGRESIQPAEYTRYWFMSFDAKDAYRTLVHENGLHYAVMKGDTKRRALVRVSVVPLVSREMFGIDPTEVRFDPPQNRASELTIYYIHATHTPTGISGRVKTMNNQYELDKLGALSLLRAKLHAAQNLTYDRNVVVRYYDFDKNAYIDQRSEFEGKVTRAIDGDLQLLFDSLQQRVEVKP